jgi:hypothetical protein
VQRLTSHGLIYLKQALTCGDHHSPGESNRKTCQPEKSTDVARRHQESLENDRRTIELNPSTEPEQRTELDYAQVHVLHIQAAAAKHQHHEHKHQHHMFHQIADGQAVLFIKVKAWSKHKYIC